MKLNFKCSNSLTVDIEVLQNSIFHLRIAPEFNTDKISALDRYSYLGNVPEDENAIIEQNDDILKIKTTDAALAFDKKMPVSNYLTEAEDLAVSTTKGCSMNTVFQKFPGVISIVCSKKEVL